MAETKEGKCNTKRNAKTVTMDTFCPHYAVTTNTQGGISNVTNETRISSDILVKTMKGFNILTIQSKINNYVYYNSKEDDAESDRKIDQLAATHKNSPQKLLINRIIS